MHCLFLGVCKHVLKTFFREGLLDERLEERLRELKVPRWIGKVMNSFNGKQKKKVKKLKSLKAAELMCFTLLYSDTILQGLLEDVYLTMWKRFSTACRMMCADQICRDDIDTIYLHVHMFLVSFEELFSSNQCIPNMHFMHEIVGYVSDFGPLHVFWCFALERMNGVMGDISNNAQNIPVTILKTFREAQESNLYLRTKLVKHPNPDLRDILQQLTTYEEAAPADETDTMRTIVRDFGYDKYLWFVETIGHVELPWTVTPVCLLKEQKNTRLELTPHYEHLCNTVKELYLTYNPDLEDDMDQATFISIKPVYDAISQRAQVFDSILGSHGNQSSPASFVLVRYTDDNGVPEEHAGRVEGYYKVSVELKRKDDGGIKQCHFAYVRWFEQHSQELDSLGVVQKTYKTTFMSREIHNPWVSIPLITAQFIPFFYTPQKTDCDFNDAYEDNAYDENNPEKLMRTCRVPLKTPL